MRDDVAIVSDAAELIRSCNDNIVKSDGVRGGSVSTVEIIVTFPLAEPPNEKNCAQLLMILGFSKESCNTHQRSRS